MSNAVTPEERARFKRSEANAVRPAFMGPPRGTAPCCSCCERSAGAAPLEAEHWQCPRCGEDFSEPQQVYDPERWAQDAAGAAPLDECREALGEALNALEWCDSRYRQTLASKPVLDVDELRAYVARTLTDGRTILARLEGADR